MDLNSFVLQEAARVQQLMQNSSQERSPNPDQISSPATVIRVRAKNKEDNLHGLHGRIAHIPVAFTAYSIEALSACNNVKRCQSTLPLPIPNTDKNMLDVSESIKEAFQELEHTDFHLLRKIRFNDRMHARLQMLDMSDSVSKYKQTIVFVRPVVPFSTIHCSRPLRDLCMTCVEGMVKLHWLSETDAEDTAGNQRQPIVVFQAGKNLKDHTLYVNEDEDDIRTLLALVQVREANLHSIMRLFAETALRDFRKPYHLEIERESSLFDLWKNYKELYGGAGLSVLDACEIRFKNENAYGQGQEKEVRNYLCKKLYNQNLGGAYVMFQGEAPWRRFTPASTADDVAHLRGGIAFWINSILYGADGIVGLNTFFIQALFGEINWEIDSTYDVPTSAITDFALRRLWRNLLHAVMTPNGEFEDLSNGSVFGMLREIIPLDLDEGWPPRQLARVFLEQYFITNNKTALNYMRELLETTRLSGLIMERPEIRSKIFPKFRVITGGDVRSTIRFKFYDINEVQKEHIRMLITNFLTRNNDNQEMLEKFIFLMTNSYVFPTQWLNVTNGEGPEFNMHAPFKFSTCLREMRIWSEVGIERFFDALTAYASLPMQQEVQLD